MRPSISQLILRAKPLFDQPIVRFIFAIIGLGAVGLLWAFYPPSRPAIFVMAVFAFFVVVWKWPERYLRSAELQSAKERIELTNEIRKTLAQFLGGLLILTGLYFTWQTVESTYHSLKLAQESQITDRYYRALQQLGSVRSEARLGAIYTLERMIDESPRDAWPTIQVLTAYVREQAHWPRESQEQTTSPEEPPPDIQAVLDILRAQNSKFRGSINLSRTDLRRADLTDLRLPYAKFDGARLDGASLIGSDLTGASMVAVNLKGAYLSMAKGQLRDIHLPRSSLMSWLRPKPARLQFARLIAANLQGAFMQGVSLANADLSCADLRGADLARADLTEADLTFADLRRAKLQGAIGLDDRMLARSRTDQFPDRPRQCQ